MKRCPTLATGNALKRVYAELLVISADTGRVDVCQRLAFVVAGVVVVVVVARRAAVAVAAALRTSVVVVVEALFLRLFCSDNVDVTVVVLKGGRETVGV